MADRAALHRRLADGMLVIEPMTERHRAGLRAACGEDDDIWAIYAVSFVARHFDASFDALTGNPDRQPFVVIDGHVVAGMTAYIGADEARQTVEIGNSYIVPRLRGGGVNSAMKRLMIDHAIECGFRRIEFRIDARNARSQAAVMKLGAVREGVLRAERITWTGHVRDTALYSILADEWRARAGLSR